MFSSFCQCNCDLSYIAPLSVLAVFLAHLRPSFLTISDVGFSQL
jgi:hypothetical protein